MDNQEIPLVISYLALRRTIGVLGILFPFILVIGSMVAGGCHEIQPTISDYYHTNMRDVFVGMLCAVALFLFSYRGYNYQDNIAGNLACILALGVAFFPSSVTDPLAPCNNPVTIHNPVTGKIHLVAASLFFITLAYFSLFLFTKGVSMPTPQKLLRNKIYKICGFIILTCLVLLILYYSLPSLEFHLKKYKPVFWIETIALWAFGVSWLVKGQYLLRDK
jgi:hypothetical protein